MDQHFLCRSIDSADIVFLCICGVWGRAPTVLAGNETMTTASAGLSREAGASFRGLQAPINNSTINHLTNSIMAIRSANLVVNAYVTALPNVLSETRGLIQRIHYVNAFPGAGKTYRAISLATKHMLNDDNGILVYAAPTIFLLEQFLSDLLKRHPELKSRIRIVHAGENQDHKRQRRKLKHADIIRELTRRIPVGVDVAIQFQAHLIGDNGKLTQRAIEALGDGDLILTTHACICNLPMNLKRKERISLIFDEARQCLHTEDTPSAPADLISRLLSGDSPYIRPIKHSSIAVYSQWVWTANHPLPSKEQLRKMWQETSVPYSQSAADKFHEFLKHIRNDRLDVWVTASDPSKDSKQRITFSVLMSPSRLFYGFGNVLILSAFFKSSQMYKLLRVKEKSGRIMKGKYAGQYELTIPDQDQVDLIDVTEQLTDAKRVAAAQERLRKVVISYVFDSRSLSRSILNNGIVVPIREKGGYDSLFNAYQQAFEDAAEEGSRRKAPSFQAMTSGNFGEDHPLLKIIEHHTKYSKHNPIQYLALACVKLYKSWNKHQVNPSIEPLLMTMNVRSGDTYRSVWDANDLDELVGDRVTHISPMCQGLNSYQNYVAAAFLASLKLTPQQTAAYNEIIPTYDSDVDRTVDQCIQFLLRCNARDANSDRPCLFLVTDKEIALEVQMQLEDTVSLVSPEELDKTFRPCQLIEFRQKETEEQRKQRVAAYNNSSKGKKRVAQFAAKLGERKAEYDRINSAIYRKRRMLKADPGNDRVKQEVAELEQRRAALKRERDSCT